jgi:phosphoribosylcarboxyaminoimidazole (NCAIR) mutase
MAKMSPERLRPCSATPVQTNSLPSIVDMPRGLRLSTTTAAQPAWTATWA